MQDLIEILGGLGMAAYKSYMMAVNLQLMVFAEKAMQAETDEAALGWAKSFEMIMNHSILHHEKMWRDWMEFSLRYFSKLATHESFALELRAIHGEHLNRNPLKYYDVFLSADDESLVIDFSKMGFSEEEARGILTTSGAGVSCGASHISRDYHDSVFGDYHYTIDVRPRGTPFANYACVYAATPTFEIEESVKTSLRERAASDLRQLEQRCQSFYARYLGTEHYPQVWKESYKKLQAAIHDRHSYPRGKQMEDIVESARMDSTLFEGIMTAEAAAALQKEKVVTSGDDEKPVL